MEKSSAQIEQIHKVKEDNKQEDPNAEKLRALEKAIRPSATILAPLAAKPPPTPVIPKILKHKSKTILEGKSPSPKLFVKLPYPKENYNISGTNQFYPLTKE